jgi:hypothetical protein
MRPRGLDVDRSVVFKRLLLKTEGEGMNWVQRAQNVRL